MDRKQPPRLTNEEYMQQPKAAVQVFHGRHSGTVSLHWHEFYELSLIVSGRGEHLWNGVSLPLSAGTIFLLTPADFHELRSEEGEPLEIYNVIFTETYIDETVYRWLFGEGHQHQAQFDSLSLRRMYMDYDWMRKECENWQLGSEQGIKATLQRLFIDLYRASGSYRMGRSPSPDKLPLNLNLQKALIYIHHHFREDLKLEDAAVQAQYSVTYFSECFSRTVGQPFQRYVQNLRMQFAESLLKTSPLSVTDICYVAGFKTLGHFERVFRERNGISPRKYRLANQTSENMHTNS